MTRRAREMWIIIADVVLSTFALPFPSFPPSTASLRIPCRLGNYCFSVLPPRIAELFRDSSYIRQSGENDFIRVATRPTQPLHWDNGREEPKTTIHRLTRNMHTSLVTRDGSLCQRCSDLDFEASFDFRPPTIGDFEFHLAIDVVDSSLTCPLCILTRRFVSWPGYDFDLFRGATSEMGEAEIRIEKSQSGQTKLWCHWYTMSESEIPIPPFPPLFPRRYDWPKDPKRVDFGPLKQKFAQCKAEHGPVCGTKNRLPVKGLRVYNCLTRKLEEATIHTEYVALSYVWGCDPEASFQKPPEQYRTICDAMKVALRFGYKYIWVDQLCIDQGGPHKLQQIQQMNRIYQNADLTIVAAAGDNSDFGIPGVQDRSRLGRECFRFGDIHLVDAASVLRSLDRTTWGTRAWTFQEAKLSNRLLVFTERTAWFSCYLTPEEEGFEAQNPKVEPVCNREAELALARKMPRPPCGLKDPRYLRDLFCEYAGRSLTYPSDAVNAFSGILTELREAKLIVSHVWGTPIMPMTEFLDSASVYDRGVTHLERNAVDGFILGLIWTAYMPVDLKPRHGIPSWSWAGWQGGIDFPYLYEKGDVNFGIEAFIERTDGQVLTWSEFEGLSYLENQSHLISRFIRLKAWTIDVRLEYHEPPSEPRWHDDSTSKGTYAVTQMRNGDELLSEAVIYDDPQDGSSKDPLDELKCRVYIGVCLGKRSMSTYYTMLLRKVDGYFQRIGHVDFWDAVLMKRGPSGEVTSLEQEPLSFSSMSMREIRIG